MFDQQFRVSYAAGRRLLSERLNEKAPGRIQLLAGPRQVGKTTLLLELAGDLGPRAVYAAADGPEAALPGFWERLWNRSEAVARAEGKAIVLLDEAVSATGSRMRASHSRGMPDSVFRTGAKSL